MIEGGLELTLLSTEEAALDLLLNLMNHVISTDLHVEAWMRTVCGGTGLIKQAGGMVLMMW
jgi:hypothetical protein